jgi:hypothetical protein
MPVDKPWEKAEARLKPALRAAGRNPAEAATIVARMQATGQRRPADALPIYDEVMGLYAGLVAGGRKEFEDDLLTLQPFPCWFTEQAPGPNRLRSFLRM